MFTMCKVKLTCKVLPSGNLKHLIYKQRNVSFSSLAALMFDLKDKEWGRCPPPTFCGATCCRFYTYFISV